MSNTEPLAYRMRPKTLEEYEGQEHVIGPGKLLYRTITCLYLYFLNCCISKSSNNSCGI